MQYAEADAPHEHYSRLLKLRLPVVLVNAAADHLDFPRVSTDDAAAMEQAYGHLVSLGHERIGLVLGPADHVPSRRKLAAFEVVAKNPFFQPRSAEDRMIGSLSEGEKARLIANGTYNADGTVNMETAERLGWVKTWKEQEEQARAAAANAVSPRAAIMGENK